MRRAEGPTTHRQTASSGGERSHPSYNETEGPSPDSISRGAGSARGTAASSSRRGQHADAAQLYAVVVGETIRAGPCILHIRASQPLCGGQAAVSLQAPTNPRRCDRPSSWPVSPPTVTALKLTCVIACTLTCPDSNPQLQVQDCCRPGRPRIPAVLPAYLDAAPPRLR